MNEISSEMCMPQGDGKQAPLYTMQLEKAADLDLELKLCSRRRREEQERREYVKSVEVNKTEN